MHLENRFIRHMVIENYTHTLAFGHIIYFPCSITHPHSLKNTFDMQQKIPRTLLPLVVVQILCPNAFPSCEFVCPWGVQT